MRRSNAIFAESRWRIPYLPKCLSFEIGEEEIQPHFKNEKRRWKKSLPKCLLYAQKSFFVNVFNSRHDSQKSIEILEKKQMVKQINQSCQIVSFLQISFDNNDISCPMWACTWIIKASHYNVFQCPVVFSKPMSFQKSWQIVFDFCAQFHLSFYSWSLLIFSLFNFNSNNHLINSSPLQELRNWPSQKIALHVRSRLNIALFVWLWWNDCKVCVLNVEHAKFVC